MALALPNGGKIITLDHDEKIVHVAKNFFKKGKLESKIETVISPALDTLKKFLQEGKKFDLVFIDADKGNYKNYYDLSLNLINANALIILDNVLWIFFEQSLKFTYLFVLIKILFKLSIQI